MDIAQQFQVKSGAETKDVLSQSNAAALLGGGGFQEAAGSSGRSVHEALKSFGLGDALPYLKMLQVMRHATGGAGFDARGGEFHRNILDYFNKHAPGMGTGLFDINAGTPAGGQLKALVDMPLSDTSIGFFNKFFIGNQILTDSPVMQQTGLIGRYGNEHNNAPPAHSIIADGRANVQQLNPYSTEFLNYEVKTYALMDALSPNDYRNYIKPFDAEQDLVIALKLLLMLVCEVDIAEKLTAAANYSGDRLIELVDDEDKFNDKANSSVDAQAETLRNGVRTACGMDPNTAVMDANTFEVISRHPDARGTIFQDMTKSRTATEAEVAKLLQVDRLLIGRSSRTTANAADAPLSRVWGKDIWMGYVAPRKGLRQRTFGYFHHYRNMDSYVISRQSVGNPVNKDIFSYMNWQHHFTDYNCGGVIKNAIA